MKTYRITYAPHPNTTHVSDVKEIKAAGFESFDNMVRFYKLVSTKDDEVLTYDGQTHKRQHFFFVPFISLKYIEEI